MVKLPELKSDLLNRENLSSLIISMNLMIDSEDNSLLHLSHSYDYKIYGVL